MTHIKTYIKTNGALVPLERFQGGVKDPRYIEGAIELTVGSTLLLDTKMWDLVDQLWAYLVNGLVAIIEGTEFTTYFPDQAIKVVLRRDVAKRYVEIEVTGNEKRRARTPFRDFVIQMSGGAAEFFDKMVVVAPENRSVYQELAARARALVTQV